MRNGWSVESFPIKWFRRIWNTGHSVLSTMAVCQNYRFCRILLQSGVSESPFAENSRGGQEWDCFAEERSMERNKLMIAARRKYAGKIPWMRLILRREKIPSSFNLSFIARLVAVFHGAVLFIHLTPLSSANRFSSQLTHYYEQLYCRSNIKAKKSDSPPKRSPAWYSSKWKKPPKPSLVSNTSYITVRNVEC